MPPSKLDRYLNILEALVGRPQQLDQIAQATTMKCDTLRQHLHFLVSNGLVETRGSNLKGATFAINERGLAVFKRLRAFKYFEKLKNSLPIVNEAREIAMELPKRPRERKAQ